MEQDTFGNPLSADEPITSATQDELLRAPLAEIIASELRGTPTERSFVVAITGRWGAGKTSMVNLVVESLRRDVSPPLIINLQPWLFSGSENLMREFLGELSAQLSSLSKKGSDLRKAADKLLSYGETLRHLDTMPFGAWLARASAATRFLRFFTRSKTAENQSTYQLKCELDKLLETSSTRILIIADDVDRLLPAEIREVMRLVRTLADFPNTAYLMAFDRQRVEEALEVESAIPGQGFGRGYLEKIVQVQHELPAVTAKDLSRLLFSCLDAAIAGTPTLAFDPSYWTDVYVSVVQPLILTVRDVKRYANAVAAAAKSLGSEVNIVDIFALEAVRVFLPDMFVLIAQSRGVLTRTAPMGLYTDNRSDEEQRTQIERLLKASGERQREAKEFLRRVFPPTDRFLDGSQYGSDFAGTWRRQRRVAAEEVLDCYIEQRLAEGALPTEFVETLFASLTNPEELGRLLTELDPEHLEYVLTRLMDYESEFSLEMAGPSIPVFMDCYGALSDERRGMSLESPRLQLTRLVYRLVRKVENESERSKLAAASLAKIRALSARVEFVRIVGHDEHVGHKLVPLEDAAIYEQSVAEGILAVDAGALRHEPEVGELVRFIRTKAPDRAAEWVDRQFRDNRLFIVLLEQSLYEVHSQTIGSYSVRSSTRLQWDFLVSLLGEEYLKDRIDKAEATELGHETSERARAALVLARQYVTGWRPPERF